MLNSLENLFRTIFLPGQTINRTLQECRIRIDAFTYIKELIKTNLGEFLITENIFSEIAVILDADPLNLQSILDEKDIKIENPKDKILKFIFFIAGISDDKFLTDEERAEITTIVNNIPRFFELKKNLNEIIDCCSTNHEVGSKVDLTYATEKQMQK
jgi:hypothetical protein